MSLKTSFRFDKMHRSILSIIISFCLMMSAFLSPVEVSAADTAGQNIFTSFIPVITESVDSSGFKHPGVGLTKKMLENVRTKVRSQAEPWNTYFNAMMTSWAASTDPTIKNQNGTDHTKPGAVYFNSQGIEARFINDALAAYTQALLYVITGNEIYRANGLHIIRIWSQMEPAQYQYYTDACIHAGVPLYRMVTAAEIFRYTSFNSANVTSAAGTVENMTWTDKDTTDFTKNLITPVTETFLHDQNHFMNQHSFPLLGAMSGYIFTGNRDRYNEAVEWFTVNRTATDQGLNGSVKQLLRWVDEVQVPGNKVGQGTPVKGHVQHIEMGRDQAHGGADLQNFEMLSNMLLAQGTKVDPVTGNASTAADAVGPYEFLNNRILAGADYFWQFMLGYDTPWTPAAYAISPDGTIRGTYNTLADGYRGRYANGNCWNIYAYYTYVKHENLAQVAPYLAEGFTKKPRPGAGGWNSADGGHDFWLYLPSEAEADAAAWLPQDKSGGNIIEVEDRYTKFDNNTSQLQEGDTTFIRFKATEKGSKIALVSFAGVAGSGPYGLRFRTNGIASLSAFSSSYLLPDTKGQWRYMSLSGTWNDLDYVTVKGTPGVTVDIDHINTAAGTQLTPPVFKTGNLDQQIYTYAGTSADIDFSASDTGSAEVITYGLQNNPTGSSINVNTGAFSWSPGTAGNYNIIVTADDGTTITVKKVNIIVSKDRASTVQAVISPYDKNTVYVTATLKNYEKVYNETMNQLDTATDEAFFKQLKTLRSAVEGLQPATPLAKDGTLRWSSVASWSSWGTAAANMDDCSNNSGAWYGLALGSPPHLYHIIDFGPDFKVSAYKFGFQSNLFPDRMANSTVYGSNDKENWTRLTSGVTQLTSDYQTLDVDSAYQDIKYRYIKLEVVKPVPDILYGIVRNFLELNEFRIYGTRYEIGNKIDSVSIGSAKSVNGKISTGDTVILTVKAKEPIKSITAKIQGIDAKILTQDNINWTAMVTLDKNAQTGPVKFTLDYQKKDGTNGDSMYLTSDNSKLFLTDSEKFLNVSALATVTASDGQWTQSGSGGLSKNQVGNLLFDGKTDTYGDLNTPSGSNSYYTVDFGSGASVSLDEVLMMPREAVPARMNGVVIQGSNDNVNWTDLTSTVYGAAANTWSDLSDNQIRNHDYYRYLRVYNSNVWAGNVAEVEFYGELKSGDDYADSKIVPPEGYTRGSYYQYQQDVTRIKEEMSKPDANKAELFKQLNEAKKLLVSSETLNGDLITVNQSMVTASTKQWGTGGTPQENGWRAFDSDINTAVDTTSNPGWVKVDFGVNNAQTIGSVKFYPRSTNLARINGSILQGSNDGTNFVNLYTINGISTLQWYTAVISDSTAYRYFRYYSPAGNANVAELQLYSPVKDKTLLELLLKEAGTVIKDHYTAESYADLQKAVSNARAADDSKSAAQSAIDAASADLDVALKALKDAEGLPVITEIGDKSIIAENLLSFAVEAAGTTAKVTYSVKNLPVGASFDAETHTFSWTPAKEQGGVYTVTFTAASDGKNCEKSVKITVKGSPSITSDTSVETTVKQTVTYKVTASDPIGSPLYYIAQNLPSGASFHTATGVFTWTPAQEDYGDFYVTFTVNNGTFEANQTVNFKVGRSVLEQDNYTKGSYYIYAKEIERINGELNKPDADKAQLMAQMTQAETQLVPVSTLYTDKINLVQSMANASSVSWDGTNNEIANGWRAFDGDTTTSPDTKTSDGWAMVDLGEGNAQVLGCVKFIPRPNQISRVNGALIQGSNDGVNYDTLYAVSGITELKWYTQMINSNTAYRYLRYYTSNGYANIGDIEFYRQVNDKTLLTLLLDKASALDADGYTVDSYTVVEKAVTAARSVSENLAATQTDIDKVSSDLNTAMDELIQRTVTG